MCSSDLHAGLDVLLEGEDILNLLDEVERELGDVDHPPLPRRLMMGSRSGSVDPGVLTYLMEKENLSTRQINDIINKKSGLVGVSGVSEVWTGAKSILLWKK